MPARALILVGVALVVSSLALGCLAHAAEADRVPVKVYFPRGDPGPRCDRVYPRRRWVRPPAVLAGALRALLAGPTPRERNQGYGGWFSVRTAGLLRSVDLERGVARVDLGDLRRLVPNASSACGSALLLAQLDRTATQFPTVRRVVYSIEGSTKAFYEWLQRSPPSP